MNIKRIVFGSSVELDNKEQKTSLNIERESEKHYAISFMHGVFTVISSKTGEQTCVSTSNVKCWYPLREEVKVTMSKPGPNTEVLSVSEALTTGGKRKG